MVYSKNFSWATFFVFWGTHLVDIYLSYLPVKQIWRNLLETSTYVPMSPYVPIPLIIAVWPLIPMFLNSGARIYGPCYMKGFLRKLIIRQNSERSGFATVGSCWLLASSCTVGDLSGFSLINTAQIYLMIR